MSDTCCVAGSVPSSRRPAFLEERSKRCVLLETSQLVRRNHFHCITRGPAHHEDLAVLDGSAHQQSSTAHEAG